MLKYLQGADTCIPLLKRATTPRVVFISSGMGSISNPLDPSFLSYNLDAVVHKASKAALNMLVLHTLSNTGNQGFKVKKSYPRLRKVNLTPTIGSS